MLERTAQFDSTGSYRYFLSRRWQPARETVGEAVGETVTAAGKTVAFVMLNPSRADDTCDDPTLTACLQFAQRWGYGGLSVVNLFGYRTPWPWQLAQVADPVGPENDRFLVAAVEAASTVVLAWGNKGSLQGRDRTVLSLLEPYRPKLTYLQLNRSGQPRHPLYIRRDCLLRPFP